MYKAYKHFIIIVIFLIILFNIVACGMIESYKVFYIENVSDITGENYLTSENLAFTKLEGVVFIPEIKEIHHGEYIIYVSAYSETGIERVVVKNLVLKDSKTNFLNCDLNEIISFEKMETDEYAGWIDGGTFTEDCVEVEDGKNYDLIIQVEVNKNETTVTENIFYKVTVKGYKTFVTPT